MATAARTGWINVPGYSVPLNIRAVGTRLEIELYNRNDPDTAYMHSIMWCAQGRITSVHFELDQLILYTMSVDNTLKLWKWDSHKKRFDHVGTVNSVHSYKIGSNVTNGLIEITHKNRAIYAYGYVEEDIVGRITPDSWRPETDHLFPDEVREQIDTFWACWSKCNGPLAELPLEIVFSICSFVATGRSGF